ncbi:MAG: dihydroorotase [Gammaproteobacteria bacterium]|nr:dihydroorotase [Gammaproteobacteria bacterium]MDE1887436.1 dihydroorotase [Gammaproteobacteria bacterium]
MSASLNITRPDDFHLHLRDGPVLRDVVAHSARRFARAIVMPNLNPPVTTTAAAFAYRARIVNSLPRHAKFQPLMTLYLTDDLPPDEIAQARASGHIYGVKLYPAGATTHSEAGVTDIRHCDATLEKMAELGIPLLVHGEVIDPAVDVFDREPVFIERVLAPLLRRLPTLKVVFEHITSRVAVDFVLGAGKNLAATLTPQHLLYNRNALLRDGIQPHYYCLPVLKRERDREALTRAAISGNPKFFLGTDSAPHARHLKESACGCAGIFNAHAAIELYAEAFEQAGALDKLEAFAAFHGADFYGLPRNRDRIALVKKSWTVPEAYAFGDHQVVPLRAGEAVSWSLAD